MKACFVGTGSIGRRHILNFVEICKQQNIKSEIHVLRATQNLLSVEIQGFVSKEIKDISLLDDFYDMIFITNPTNLHFEMIDKLKNRSNYFFVEKPLFENCSRKISSLQLPQEKIYYVACPLRYTRVLRKAKQLLKEEMIFSVRSISSSYLPSWRSGDDYRNSYSAYREKGGGVKLDIIHEWDYLLDLFGKPSKLNLIYGKYSELEIKSEDLAVYIAEYPDKVVEVHLDYFGKYPQRKMEVITNNSFYKFDILNSKIYKDEELLYDFKDVDINEKYLREMENFFDIYRDEVQNRNSLERAFLAMEIAEGVFGKL